MLTFSKTHFLNKTKMPKRISTLILLFGCFSLLSANDSVTIQTNYGKLEGFVHQLGDGQLMDVFLGVPYAQPPVGELRFEKPMAPHRWKGIKAATEHPPVCIPHAKEEEEEEEEQEQKEDCLYLNVFVLHNGEITTNQSAHHQGHKTQAPILYPILFIIHGGAFQTGSAQRYEYADLGEKFVSRGIAVVVVQYRLGVLGFASTGDAVLPGNLGLWDIAAALRWVKDECAAWGGDSDRITAFGYSAGSAAVSMLGLSPHTRQLFDQAIQMSGSPLAQTKVGTFVPNDTLALAKVLGCQTASSLQVKQCFLDKTVEELHDAVDKIGPARSDVNFAKFTSRVDSDFFPRDYLDLIQEAPPKRTMMGHTRLESLLFTLHKWLNDTTTLFAVPFHRRQDFGQADFEHVVRDVVVKEEYFGVKTAKIRQEVIDFYTRKHSIPRQKDSIFYLERYSMVLTDLQYVLPFVWESRLKADKSWPLFLYEFAWSEPQAFPDDISVHEAYHLLDHALLFAGGFFEAETETAKAMSRLLNEAVANFVLHSNPSTNDTLWVAASQAEPMRHLVIDGPRPRMQKMLERQMPRIKFWHQLTELHQEFNLIMGTFGKEKRRQYDEL